MAQDASNPQKVNPALLVVLGLVVVGGAIYWFTSMPKSSAPTAAVANVPAPGGASNANNNFNQTSGVTKSNSQGQAGKNDNKLNEEKTSGFSSTRNPFLVPPVYATASISPDNQSQGSQTTITPTTTPTPKPSTSPAISPDEKPDKNNAKVVQQEPEWRLGGVFLKSNDKLALIYYNGKPFIIREREVIKGSGYQLKHIASDWVSLASVYGDEMTLKIDEKALKAKGGDH